MKQGDIVEGFAAPDQFGRTVTLDELLEGGFLVLYFYPKAMTGG